jgi:dienelactone hydrolase
MSVTGQRNSEERQLSLSFAWCNAEQRSAPLKYLLAGLLALSFHAMGGAQTAWPDYIATLPRAVSESPVKAELPAALATLEPDAQLPPELARWSGAWNGWGCRAALCDLKLAVRKLTPAGALVTYAGASATSTIVDEVEASFVGDELQARLKTGAKLVMRLRADGDMEVTAWRPETQLLMSGVMSRHAPAYSRDTAWIETPWAEDGKPVRLELVIHRPPGAGPFPTVVMNHGSTGEGNHPEWFKQTWTSPELSAFFIARGWQVMYPQRRGRGRSDGLHDEGFTLDRSRYSCDAALSLPGAEHALADLDVAIAAIRARPDVDAKRMLVGGVSRGGILATAYAGRHPQEMLGVINFVGGWLGSACPDAAAVNGKLFTLGAAFPRDTLWLYGERDPFYPIRHSRGNFEAFEAAGGHGSFHVYAPPKPLDGHGIYLQPALWGGDADAYLRSLKFSP